MLKGLILGILLGVALVAGCIYFYFSSGRAPVATSAPPMPLERRLAKLGLHAYLDRLPHPAPQVAADEANMVSGAKVYKNSARCAMVFRMSPRARSKPECFRRHRNSFMA